MNLNCYPAHTMGNGIFFLKNCKIPGKKYFLLAIAIAIFSFTSQATVYYISSSGNDSNPGTSEGSAWRSIEKVNNTSFKAGDQILFKRGDSWVGTVKVTGSGTSGSPIVYGAYGTGAKPVIYGSKTISGWTQYSGNIYYATLEDDNIYQIFQDNVPLQSARYPNSGYHYITGLTSQTQFSSTGLNAGKNYAGCTIILRDSPWSLQTKKVNSSSGQTLTINSATAYSLSTGKGFFLYGHLDFLTGAGQWYLDKSANRLYVWTTNGTSPSNFTIRYSKETNNITASSKNHIKIENLDLRHANDEGIMLTNCSYVTINNCNIEYSTARCINFEGSSNNGTVTNNTIKGAAEFGIYARGGNYTISDNVVEEISTDIGIYGTGWGLYGSAIAVEYGSNNTVRYNHVRNVGYHGISYFDAPYTTVEYNYVLNAGLTKDDCGGIYCYESATAGEDSDNSVIRYNIVENVTGIKDGTIYNFVQGVGIYLDERISEQTVQHNTVIGGGLSGIYLHLNNQNCRVENNTFFDCGIGHRVAKGSSGKGNSIQNNIFYNIKTTVSHEGKSNPILGGMQVSDNSAATLNYNRYVDKHRKTPFRQTEGTYPYLNFSEWKAITGLDKNSTFDSTPLATGETEVLFYNNTKQAKTFSLGTTIYKDIDGKQVSGSISLQPFTSIILIKTTSTTGSSNQKPVIQGQNFQINSDVPTNTFVGQVTASDPDQGQLLSYAITGGNHEGLFYIETATGKIYTKTNITNTQDKSVGLIVTVTDNAASPLSASATVTVNITATIISQPVDTSSPVVSSFSIPQTSGSLTIPVTLNASDNIAVAGYLITEAATPPLADNSAWLPSAPTSYTVSSEGTFTLYAWAKDVQGNVSTAVSASVTIVLQNISLSSEYLFEETSGTVVYDSKGSNNGNIINTESRCEGVNGKGLTLTGSNYINLGICFCDVQNKITLSAWVKPNVNSSGYQGIIMKGGPVDDTYAIYINPGTKQIAFKASGTSSPWMTVSNMDLLWDGNWHNITATYDGSQMIIYLDNVVIAKTNSTGNITSGAGYNLLVGAGRDTNPPSLFYKGEIDEVRIYNYALSAEEVSQLYNSVVNVTTEPVYATEEVSICQGENYLGWTQSGTYLRTLTTSSGADSIVTTTLTVNTTYLITEEITINEGENYLDWTQSGQYQRTLTAVTGCDSIIVTNLIVLQMMYSKDNLHYFTEYNNDSTQNSLFLINLPIINDVEFANYSNSFYILKENDFNLYPNPAQGYIEINYLYPPSENTNLKIIDINGEIIHNQNIASLKTIININQYNPGIYFVISVDSNEQIIKKLIVQ